VPEHAGIWRVDLTTGKQKLLLSFADAMKVPNPHGDWTGAKHWFNHLLVSPGGSRFIFLHRWRGVKEGRSFATRMFTADRDGRELYVLDPYGKTSHFIWRDARHVLAWAWHPSHGEKFYLYTDRTDRVEVIGEGVMTVNGHCTYLPGNRWILNDTYPDKERKQHVYLYNLETGRRIGLGDFYSPAEYKGEWRCDTHPRFSPDATKVVIDSPHGGNGRQMYLIDISGIVERRR
jgi:Tol biopolymer transport system component